MWKCPRNLLGQRGTQLLFGIFISLDFLLLLFSFFQQLFKLHAASQMTSGKYSAEFKAVLEKTSQVSNEPSGKTKEM